MEESWGITEKQKRPQRVHERNVNGALVWCQSSWFGNSKLRAATDPRRSTRKQNTATSEEPGMATSTGHSQVNTQELAPGLSCCLSPGEPQTRRESGLRGWNQTTDTGSLQTLAGEPKAEQGHEAKPDTSSSAR